MQGMMFGGEGPVMQGTWYNPSNGDAFTVRDSFFEDNQFIVMTTDGRCLKYNQLQNYIQSDMKLEDLKKREPDNKSNEALPAEVANILESSESTNTYNEYMLPEDNVLTRGLGNIGDSRVMDYELNTITKTNPNVQQTPVGYVTVDKYNNYNNGGGQSMNEAIIEKALKNAEKPEFVVNVSWDNFPTKQIEMLKDIMEIPEDEIIDWYLDNINMMEVVDALKTAIKSRILYVEGEELTNQIKAITDTNVSTVNNCCDPGFYVELNSDTIFNAANKISNKDDNIVATVSPKKTTTKKTTSDKKTNNTKK